MNYKIALYVTDYLLLLELTGKLESEFPAAQIMVFGDKVLEKGLNLPDDTEYVVTDISRINEAEVLIILSEPSKILKDIEKFDGTIIDYTGAEFAQGAEVYKIDEPVGKVLKNLAVPNEDVSAVVSLPVCVFGKDGVEDLMRQTKDIFSFDEGDNLVFENRIAFNVHFNPENVAQLPVGKILEDFRNAGGDVSLRIAPISTVFIIDAYAKDAFGLKEDKGYKVTDGFFTVSDVSEHGDVFVIQRRNGYTFIGDYMRVLVNDAVEKLKEVI